MMMMHPPQQRRLENRTECKVDHPIDLISIDVEGQEFDVLHRTTGKSTGLCLAGDHQLRFEPPETNPVHNFILDRGYVLFTKTYNTVFYKDRRAFPEARYHNDSFARQGQLNANGALTALIQNRSGF